MSINAALLIILLLIAVFFLFVEIFTVLFMLTGLPERKARFQVISILTNTGFTTGESEVITSSRRRRRLATITMLFGYIYAVAIVSMIINALLAFEKSGDEDPIRSVLTLVGGVAVLLLAKRLPFVRDRFEAMIRRLASRVMFSAASNPLLVLDYYGDSAIVEIRITDLPEPLVGKTLAEGPMKTEYGLLVFAIKRAGETRHDVGPTDVLQTGDRIVLFGSLKSVHALFRLKPSFSRDQEEEET
jgi:Trk-type K+ transport system membrane component